MDAVRNGVAASWSPTRIARARSGTRRGALPMQLKAGGCTGGHTRLTDFLRDRRQHEGKRVSTQALISLKFELGGVNT